MKSFRLFVVIMLASLLGFHPIGFAQEPESTTSNASVAGSALSTMFSPVHAPARKTMGLLQRSFVDMATQTDQPLEVAIVVDGTESMTSELIGVRDSVQQMLADLRRCRGEVRVAIVVYRDAGSPSGETSLFLKNFSTDVDAISAAVGKLKPETGEPFFHELADVGVHAALTELPWSENPLVTRWILWFGDAPPYADSFNDPRYPLARRRFANELLVTIAARKRVQINGVLCKSGQDIGDAYDKTLDKTRSFMSALVSGTGGLMLDLSYEDIRIALVDAGKRPTVSYTELAPITQRDLTSANNEQNSTTAAPVVLAVLPYQPLSQVSFDPQLDTVQIATAIRHRLEQIPGVRMKSPVEVRRQIRRLQAEGLSESEQLRGIAARLGVDFVVWGQVESPSDVQTAAYRSSDGQAVITVASSANPDQVADVFIQAASKASEPATNETGSIGQLSRSILANYEHSPLQGTIAESTAVQSEILASIEALEQAVAHESGSEVSNKLLTIADQSIQAAIRSDRRNALAHWLAANIAMNRANASWAVGNREPAERAISQMRSSLRSALAEARHGLSPSQRLEIEADEALLVQRDYVTAIEKYESLATSDQPLASQRRAHWMLAGLRAGDWGASEWALANKDTNPKAVDLVNAKQVREHVIQILAHWPESPQAELLRRWLQWDDTTKQTRFHHFPHSSGDLANSGLAQPAGE